MRIPESPPPHSELFVELTAKQPELSLQLLADGRPVDPRGRYLHWDQLRRRTPPNDWTSKQWWLATAIARQALARPLPLVAVDGQPFRYSNIDRVQELVHRIDQQASGHILADQSVTNPRVRDRFVISSLIEEAITSSQLEGASTTRPAAREMLQSGRLPQDRSERMILNNYEAIRAVEELASGAEPLTPSHVLELHRIVTRDTLDDERDAGRLQMPGDERIVVGGYDGQVVYQPPPAEELPDRLERLCDFANGSGADGFIHPVVRAIVLHFVLAYDHPFADGNGRTARALFYWSMLRSGYWLAQFLSISSILRRDRREYAESYLHVETDNNDVTYFVIHQLEVIVRALKSLDEYLARKMKEQRDAELLLRGRADLNHRQHVLISDALRDPGATFTIQAQANRHGVTYETARTDLLRLEKLGLFSKTRVGKKFIFVPLPTLTGQLAADN